jgi:hypothetical protein
VALASVLLYPTAGPRRPFAAPAAAATDAIVRRPTAADAPRRPPTPQARRPRRARMAMPQGPPPRRPAG